MKYNHTFIYLIIILALGGFLRFYGINWDQGHHLHPDERAIVMSTTPLQFPKSLDETGQYSSILLIKDWAISRTILA